jgi:serine/threonine protein kinase
MMDEVEQANTYGYANKTGWEPPGAEQAAADAGGKEQPGSEESAAHMEGDIILVGRYRIVRLLYQRPRLNLYLARRVSAHPELAESAGAYEPLVAIRELILTDLAPEVRAQIEAAAFEEFVAPVVLGSPRLPTVGDRVRIECERHYLVMQLQDGRDEHAATTVTLEELLLSQRQWPTWLDQATSLNWATQLCRIVARLHRLGVVLGELDPSTILVDSAGRAAWAPVLLVSWPPPPHFWPPVSTLPTISELYAHAFPIVKSDLRNAFVAPEMLDGIYGVRSDVYALGAILYLLLTHYAPVAAAHRLLAARMMEDEQEIERGEIRRGQAPPLHPGVLGASPGEDGGSVESEEGSGNESDEGMGGEGLELIPPRLLCRQMSSELEKVVLRALALDPIQRYASAFELAEALEAVE